ncbi:MAG: Mov34/MPN/PAD-1 family protein [Solirubrobacterales bacterium]
MRIAQKLIDQVVAHARADLPNECCGMIGGMNGGASTVIPVVNSAASPLRFEMDPQGQYDALKTIEDDGGEMLAIYHSHTKSAAYPSQTDVNQAVNWPDAIYVIVSLQDADAPEVKAYWLKDLKIVDAELIVE